MSRSMRSVFQLAMPENKPASFSLADRPGSSTIGRTAAIASVTMRATTASSKAALESK